MTTQHSVVVVDDQAPFRQAAKAVLRRLDGFEFVGEASNGIEATRRIVSAHPEVVVFLCSTYDASDLPPGAADSGASAYLNKERFGAELLRRLWAARGAGSFQIA
jgi:DNA-binding NarL/FixJ family response regulator